MTASVFHRTRPFWVALFALFLGVSLSLGASHALADPKFPDLNDQRVVDDAHLLSDATKADLTLKLKGLEDATTDQVVIVTVPDLQGYDIADYGYQLGRHWGIGQSGQEKAANGQAYKDNGILLIVAPTEHKVRIEVGYGLEPVMTDAMSSLILSRAVLPEFKSGNYEGGIVAGTDQIIEQLSIDRGVAVQKAQAAAQTTSTSSRHHAPPIFIILIVIFIILFSRGWLPWFLLGSVLGGGRGGDWGGGGGGGFGGGGFSGGGGSFGGGGSSGSW